MNETSMYGEGRLL